MLNITDSKNVYIVGGGTAGWICSFFAKEIFPRANIKVIEPSSINTIGAGEGTYRNFNYFLEKFDIDERDFMDACGATLKLGIKYKDWDPEIDFYHLFKDKLISRLDAYESDSSFKLAWAIAQKKGFQ